MQDGVTFFKRAVFENAGVLTEDKLVENLKQEFQALCIVNTKKKGAKNL